MNKKSNSFEKFVKTVGIWLISVALLIAIIASSVYIYYFSWMPSSSHEKWAQFGDFMGGTLNPVFGFISLLAILITLFVQARELSHSTEALQDQGESLRVQAFENTFFSLLKLFNESIYNFSIAENNEPDFKGYAVFRKLGERLDHAYKLSNSRMRQSDEIEVIKSAYSKFYSHNHEYVDIYLRNVRQIMLFVKDRCPYHKKQYLDMFLAQLSNHQLLLVFYHAYVSPDFVSKDFLKENEFFSPLPSSMLLSKLHANIKDEVF
ncbi:putative membrane protein [Halomonas fontilapidosi]|uniref:Putative membrane protein n=1 Tax=Halomonas fontilapidosi TaxID=616675 RepID=A0A7W5DME6_9GAMM|nr:putative phage abortive infection protein [Halomonas fontilapidosi]MBB3185497.1 putative membrane protein [Halomonas fontilapidosi]